MHQQGNPLTLKLGVWMSGCFMVLLTGIAATAQAASFTPIPAGPEHIKALHNGGYVLYVRHGKTDTTQPDQIPVDLSDCSKQRPLSDAGREELAQLAGWFAQLDVPHTTVHVSAFCRAQESADILFPDSEIEIDPDLRYTASMPKAEREPLVAHTKKRVSTPVTTPGKNQILVAHGPNIAEIMDYLPPEGTMIIFDPTGNGFEYVASIEPEHWPVLLEQLD